MNFAGIPLVSIMTSRMEYDSERQSALAQNVANADTPNYRTQDVSAPDFLKMAAGGANAAGGSSDVKMIKTNPMHMTSMAAPSNFKMEARATTAELHPNGNNVAIEDEMRIMAQNQMDYTKTINLYQKMISMFKTALDSGSNGS